MINDGYTLSVLLLGWCSFVYDSNPEMKSRGVYPTFVEELVDGMDDLWMCDPDYHRHFGDVVGELLGKHLVQV